MYLVLRSASPVTGTLMIRFHDVGVILQFLFMMPVAYGLYIILRQQSAGMSRFNLNMGIAALLFTVLFLSPGSLKVISDTLYMFPQGVFGVWLIVINRVMKGIIPRGLRRLGTVAGIGLALVGTFPIAFAIFVDPVVGFGPIPKNYNDKETFSNLIVHIILLLGTFMGVTTFPIWSILLGRKLLKLKGE